ncbi:hypothetical protein [Stenotrophomonas virus Jojan60]|nr:hypothetical protein [Stenotrophomonas virus Jojan60]
MSHYFEVKNLYPGERRLELRFYDEEHTQIRVTNLAVDEARTAQFTYVTKEDLLDALAQIGWLPADYRKPEPLDPREAKIQEVVLNLVNRDRETYGTADAAESYAEAEADNINLTVYRNNAEALIDAGLVKIDE